MGANSIADLVDLLNGILTANPEAEAAVLMSKRGVVIAEAFVPGIIAQDKTRIISGMTKAFFPLSKEAITEMERSDFDQLCIAGSDGHLLVLPIGSKALLILSSRKRINKIDLNKLVSLRHSNPPGSAGAAASASKDL